MSTQKYTREFYEEGLQLCLESAESLLKMAKISGKNKEFGIGLSLAILSAEEGIKGFLCMAQIIDNKYPLEEFDKVFTSHKVKHYHIKNIMLYLQMTESMQNNLRTAIPSILDTIKDGTPDADLLRQIITPIFEAENVDNRITKLFSWWQFANDLKKNGIYVDRNNNSWINPRNTSKNKYEEAIKFASYLIEFLGYINKESLDFIIRYIKIHKGKDHL